jgi:tetratricopeptide (TPR) repeat protein
MAMLAHDGSGGGSTAEAEALYLNAVHHREKAEWNEALSCIEKAIQLNRRWKYVDYRAAVLDGLGRHEDANQAREEALRLSKQAIFLNLEAAFELRGDGQRALERLQDSFLRQTDESMSVPKRTSQSDPAMLCQVSPSFNIEVRARDLVSTLRPATPKASSTPVRSTLRSSRDGSPHKRSLFVRPWLSVRGWFHRRRS